MQISLISPYPSILNLGLRTISAVLRQAGHNTQMILKKNQSPKVRFKSIDQIKNELFWVKNNLPFVSNISIEDDSFIDRKDIRYIAQLFKEFGFSFRCLVSPQRCSEELLKFLCDCGMLACHVGLQSRAPRIEAMHNRVELNRKIDMLFEIFKKNHFDVPLLVDILVNNPWETTEETIYTLRYLLDHLPPKAILGINSLIFYRGTKLYEKAMQDNLLESRSYLKTWHWRRQREIHYTTLMFALLKLGLPRILIRFLSTAPFIFVFERKKMKGRINIIKHPHNLR